LAVTWAAIVSVVTLFGGEQVLDDLAITDGKVPYDPTRAPKPRIVPAALTLHRQLPGMCAGRRADVLGRVNRNKAWPHCSTNEPTVNVWGQEREPNTRQSRRLMLRRYTGCEQERCQYHTYEEENSSLHAQLRRNPRSTFLDRAIHLKRYKVVDV
jgi:hypothetical protein